MDTLVEGTLEVIGAAPERLTEVPGIGPVRARHIAETWQEQRRIREVMAALQGYFSRTLVYTALTRARRLAVFVGQKRALGLAVHAGRRTSRQAAVAELLTDELHFAWPETMQDDSAAQHVAEHWAGLLDTAAEFPG